MKHAKKQKPKRRSPWLFLAVCMFFLLTAAGGKTVWADTLTMTVERFSLGGSFILEPESVEFAQGETCADVVTRTLTKKGIHYDSKIAQYGFYLEGIQGVDCGFANIPSCVQDVIKAMNQTVTDNKRDGLYEFSYTGQSGWMFSVNHVFPDKGMGSIYPSDGDVIRVMFTLAGLGADLRGSSQATGYGGSEGSWVEIPALHFYDTADKSELVRLMGEANKARAKWEQIEGFPQAYEEAVQVMAAMDATDHDVREAAQWLKDIQAAQGPGMPETSPSPTPGTPETSPSPTPGTPETSPSPAPETPGIPAPDVPQLLKAESAAYNCLKLTWKGAKGAEGYEICRSVSKNRGYRTVKTITQAAKTTYTDRGLDTGKIYYYKIRGFRTVNGQKQYGPYSVPKGAKPSLGRPTLKSTVQARKVKLKWSRVRGADGYVVYRSTSKSGNYKNVKVIKSIRNTSWTDSRPGKGKAFYKVRAYRKVGGKKVYGGYSARVQGKGK